MTNGAKVNYEVYHIHTEVTEGGSTSRGKRSWQLEEEDFEYDPQRALPRGAEVGTSAVFLSAKIIKEYFRATKPAH